MTALSEATARLAQYNLGKYSVSNPYGLSGTGGMDANWEQALADIATATNAGALISGIASVAVPAYGMTWDTGTTDADPGTGKIRANHATISSATFLYVSSTDATGVSIVANLVALGASTSTIKALLRVGLQGTAATRHDFNVTAVTAGTGYYKLAVTYISGSGTFAASDAMAVGGIRNGDKGDTGLTGATGSSANYVATVGGTADAITLTPSPALGSYTAGNGYEFIATNTNTTTPTVNISGLGTKTIVSSANVALTAGAITSGTLYRIVYDGTNFRLLAPGTSSSGGGGGGVPDGLLPYYHAATGTKTKASPTVSAGNQLLVYGIGLADTTTDTPISHDLYFYTAVGTTEVQLYEGMPVPYGGPLEAGNLEPMFVLLEGDELRMNLTAGTGTFVIYGVMQAVASVYEQAVKILTTSYVSQFTAVTGSTTKRVVSCLIGNYLGTATAYASAQHYQNVGTTAWDLRPAVPVQPGSVLQAFVDGLGPKLILSDEFRLRASDATTLAAVSVAKVV